MQPYILVVDDDQATLSGLAELLATAGYRVVTAANYEAGRAALRAEQPDVLLVDVRLDNFNGLQLIVNAPGSAAVVITGHDDKYIETEAHRLGADYFVKPVTPAVLLTAIEHQLERRKSGS